MRLKPERLFCVEMPWVLGMGVGKVAPNSTCYDRDARCRGLFGEGPVLTGTPKAQVSARKRSGTGRQTSEGTLS